MLVSAFVETSDYNYLQVYTKLYSEVYHRCKVNVVVKARNRNMRTLDFIEEEGLMEDLFAIATEVLT